MLNKKWFSIVGSLTVISIISVGCNSNTTSSSTSSSDGTGSEIATAAIGGSVESSEGSVALEQGIKKPSFFVKLGNSLQPISRSWAVPSCDWRSDITGCSDNVETITFGGCSEAEDRAIAIQGSESLYWKGEGCCTKDPLTASSTTPCSYTRRTVNKDGISDPLIRSVGAHAIALDTEGSSGYSEPKKGGFEVACQGTDSDPTCNGQRQITIQGAHYSGRSGRAVWDHTVSTDSPIVIQGHGSGRKVLSGKIRVQHNSAQFESITTVTSALFYDDHCCFPTGGTVSTTFTGGPFDGKTETVTYGPECGASRLKDTDQKETGFTLEHCL